MLSEGEKIRKTENVIITILADCVRLIGLKALMKDCPEMSIE